MTLLQVRVPFLFALCFVLSSALIKPPEGADIHDRVADQVDVCANEGFNECNYNVQTDSLSIDSLKAILRDEVVGRLEELGKISDADDHLERTFLSPAMLRAVDQIQAWMTEAGMRTWVDGMGNVHGRIDGGNSAEPALLIGSHLDTVIDGGKYDGALGIITGIAAVKALLLETKNLTRPVEVIAFSEEEGVRFKSTFLGSRAICGNFDLSNLHATDKNDETLRTALEKAGLATEKDEIEKIKYEENEVYGYIEVHIEQGPVLEHFGVPLGVVPAIAGQTRLLVTVLGAQGHAGTVPMSLRKDALAGASELIYKLEKDCEEMDQKKTDKEDGLVCTVGEISVWPGASNVIPSKVAFSVDIRSPSDAVRNSLIREFEGEVKDVCAKRNLLCEAVTKHSAPATQTNPDIVQKLQVAASQALQAMTSSQHDVQFPLVVSGAGHDAMAMANLTKVGMLFVRCKGGISHSPEESVLSDDIYAGSLALLHYLRSELVAP